MRPSTQILQNTDAGRALATLKEFERQKLAYLFRNAHAVIKNNRPLSDYKWLCSLDKVKGLDIGDTYLSDKAAFNFISSIAEAEKQKTKLLIETSPFFSFLLDGTTDISGDEQEAMYIRLSSKGKIIERFLGIGTPKSTSSKHLEEFITVAMFDSFGIDKGKNKIS